jgi:hypothetical protein
MDGLAPATVMVPVYGLPGVLGRSAESADETRETVRFEVPVLGVVPEVGETASQPLELAAVAVKLAVDPPADT